MRDSESPAALIEQIVAGARIPDRRRREDLRRELCSHFEEVGSSEDAVREAMRRFGPPSAVTDSLRRVYRRDYLVWYAVKIGVSMFASVVAALMIQGLVSLWLEGQAELWRLAPSVSRAAGVTVAVVLGLIAMWEVTKPPFNLSRAAAVAVAYLALWLFVQFAFSTLVGSFVTATILLVVGLASARSGRKYVRVLVMAGAFAATLYVRHLLLSVPFGPSRALFAGAVLVAVWLSTTAIQSRADRVFARMFESAHPAAA